MSDSYGEWPLQRLMTEVVGSGPKSAADMSREQAAEAFERILDLHPDPTTLGAFWLANRWKRNNGEELGAYVDVMREESVVTAEPDADPWTAARTTTASSRALCSASPLASSRPPLARRSSSTLVTACRHSRATRTSTSSTNSASAPRSPRGERADGRRGGLRLLLPAELQPGRRRAVGPPREDGRPDVRQHRRDAR